MHGTMCAQLTGTENKAKKKISNIQLAILPNVIPSRVRA